MPERRPAWTHTLRMYLIDDVFEDPSYDDSHDDLLAEIEATVDAILCRTYGHDIVDDQCMIPAHRFCLYCGRREGTITIAEAEPVNEYTGLAAERFLQATDPER
jgi:hypothetical protein